VASALSVADLKQAVNRRRIVSGKRPHAIAGRTSRWGKRFSQVASQALQQPNVHAAHPLVRSREAADPSPVCNRRIAGCQIDAHLCAGRPHLAGYGNGLGKAFSGKVNPGFPAENATT